MKDKKKVILTTEELAEAFGIDTKTVYRWVEEGLAYYKQGDTTTPHQFNLPECIEWYKNRAVNKAVGGNIGHEKFRVMRATADKLELEVAEKQGKLVKYDDVLEVWSNTFANIRNALMNIPKQFGQIWAGIETRYVAEEELEKTIRQILEDNTDVKY